MKNKKLRIKRNLCIGLFINYLLFSATTPMVNLFFIQKISSFMYSITNWVSIILGIIMNKILKKKTNRNIIENKLVPIILLDTVLFILSSIIGKSYINVRFLGLAILNSTTTTMWVCTMRSNINKIFISEELTEFNINQDYVVSIAELLGASSAILITKIGINIDILMSLQIMASLIMGYFDYKALQLIKKVTNKGE